ncbi:MAG: hypothetical protein JWQ21_1466 [Herminiimonas sp.]|nr:hypothetical protein [Herminiimonas sp.]
MANTLVRVYDRFSDAENARNALLSVGFPPSSVHLSSTEDEAGPVEGNFTVGNKDAGTAGGISGFFRSLRGGDDQTYERDYSRTVQRASYLMTVDADDDDQAALACHIMNRFGAIDVGARTSGCKSEVEARHRKH